ncbi:hypothetical protein TrLO_g1776 [Triparma laevis f. longispina]|uniref:Uncharacterized protein n=1 Tax=Triparma laevis f. longispina TaxID=1714387 RepID=A0A9W7FRR6_9STRA|nr:hypothetical protein TrLO_g1776 [Triparma laevis f. longispina]
METPQPLHVVVDFKPSIVSSFVASHTVNPSTQSQSQSRSQNPTSTISSPTHHDPSLTSKITFDSYVTQEKLRRSTSSFRPASAGPTGSVSLARSSASFKMSTQHIVLDVPTPGTLVGRERKHRTHTKNRRPMSAPSTRSKPLHPKPTSATPNTNTNTPPTPTSRPRPVSASNTTRNSKQQDTHHIVAFGSTTSKLPPPRPQSSPIYLKSTHPSQKSLGHKIHDANSAPPSWQKKKIACNPAISSRVKLSDRLKRAQQFGESLQQIETAMDMAKADAIGQGRMSPETIAYNETPELKALNIRRVTTLLQQKSFKEALDVCNDAIELVDSTSVPDPKFYAFRGAAHLGLGSFHNAERDCEVAYNLDPTLSQALFWVASARRALNNWKGVIKATNKVIVAEPHHSASWALRCEAKRKLGLWKSVLKDTTAFVKFDSKNGAAHCARAEALMHVGKLAEAEKSATNGIKYDPSISMLYQIRGEARYQLRRYKLSLSDFHDYAQLERIKNNAPFTPPSYAIWKSNRSRPW